MKICSEMKILLSGNFFLSENRQIVKQRILTTLLGDGVADWILELKKSLLKLMD